MTELQTPLNAIEGVPQRVAFRLHTPTATMTMNTHGLIELPPPDQTPRRTALRETRVSA